MKIEIKLPDPKYCNGCPCLIKQAMTKDKCCVGFPIEYSMTKTRRRVRFKDNAPLVLRPKICIERHGE